MSTFDLITAPNLTELLWAGHTFDVHRGIQPSGDHVIVKQASTHAKSVDATMRLNNEFLISRNIHHHDAVVTASYCLNTSQGLMLVFPDHKLSTLDTISSKPLPTEKIIQIALKLANALALIHKDGVIHLDINPSNILVSADLTDIRLIDFCIAQRTDQPHSDASAKLAAKGSPHYMSPEQSDRINRHVDQRSDLYSLGVTLYQLATGTLPFVGEDTANIICSHLTKEPDPPHKINSSIPRALSESVMRLLAKNPEERFQSALEFSAAVSSNNALNTSNSFIIPDKLYGREQLFAHLSETIAHHLNGESRFIRVAGPSGNGKSALVAALAKPLMDLGANFIYGKFEQLDQLRPYDALIQACNMLLRKILSQPDKEVKQWRRHILDALSPNGQILLDVLPEYIKLIDSQPAVPQLGLKEARIRMSMVFRRFVSALTSTGTPIVVFLDDLQWSDVASLDIIELLLKDSNIQNLTIIAAYRDNEIGADHPATSLFSTLSELEKLQPPIMVSTLEINDVATMIGDSLKDSPENCTSLAHIIMQKTAGNPFFIRQFLIALVRKKLITLSPTNGHWIWQHSETTAEQFTDNVADLVIERILELPEQVQEKIKLAACFGNTFSSEDLTITGNTEDSIIELLTPAIDKQIIVLDRNSTTNTTLNYRFQHDRVQKAAYELLPHTQRGELHAQIGKILIERGQHEGADVIKVTDHLASGCEHLELTLQKQLHLFALKAARRTKKSNAYQATQNYLKIAGDALYQVYTTPAQPLLFEINIERAETAYLIGDISLSESIANDLLQTALLPLQEITVLELKILIHSSRLEYRDAISTGRQAMALLGVHLPPCQPSKARMLLKLASTELKLFNNRGNNLLNLPTMQDTNTLAAMRVLSLLAPPAYFSEKNLLPIITMTQVCLTIDYGNAPTSAYGFVLYGMIQCVALHKIESGQAYGNLALKLVKTPSARDIEGSVKQIYAGFVLHWSAPLSDTLPIYLDGAEKSLSVGDLEFHGYNRYGHVSYALMGGFPLDKVVDYLDQHLVAVTEAVHEKTHRIMLMALASINCLRGHPNDAIELYSSEESFRLWTEQDDATSLAYYHKYQLLENLMIGDFEAVLTHARKMASHINGILSMAYQPFYQFYEALALIETSKAARFHQRQAKLIKARVLIRRLSKWSDHSPITLKHRVTLLRAELAAFSGNTDIAIKGYELAAEQARHSVALHDIGLILERTACFYLQKDTPKLATTYFEAAIEAHKVWGAHGWCNAIAQRHPTLIKNQRPADLNHRRETKIDFSNIGSIDSQNLIKAANALAQHTSQKDINREVMHAIVMNAGATRGVLMLQKDNRLKPVIEILLNEKVNETALKKIKLPRHIINFVKHTKDKVILHDALNDDIFGTDPYIVKTKPYSVLCSPVMAQGNFIGIVYLENSGLRNAFREDLCETVDILATQAAITIDNHTLFESLEGALEKQVDLTSAHARFVPHAFLELLNRPSIQDIKLGDYKKGRASILFSDMRDFTKFIEHVDPDEAVAFINDYLSLMEPPILKNDGFVDAYIGDALMAVFDRGPEAAIDAGIAMGKCIHSWNHTRQSDHLHPVHCGIGIATGDLIFGTIGAANRMKCGVIGDTVNLASRIESLTKFYSTNMLITSETFQELASPDKYHIREIDHVAVAGREQSTRLFEIFDADPDALREQKNQTITDIESGLKHYQEGKFETAYKSFEHCIQLAPDDPLPKMLAKRCKKKAADPNQCHWDGIERFDTKQ